MDCSIKDINKEWIKCPFARQVNALYESNGTFVPEMSHGKSEHVPSKMAAMEVRAADHFALFSVDFKESESMIV